MVSLLIAWKPIRQRWYPYLQRTYRRNGKIVCDSLYLGHTPEAAESTLRSIKLSEAEERKVIAELYRKQPKEPPTAQAEKKAVRQLKRIAEWYGTSERVQQAVSTALAILEGGKGNG